MKAITLTEPWATLVAIGAKHIETRTWTTKYRGDLAIHAARTFPAWESRVLIAREPFRSALKDAGVNLSIHLTTGCVLAIVELVDVLRIPATQHAYSGQKGKFYLPPDEPELNFGDYSAGRYAWIFSDLRRLARPLPAKGSLGLWNWEPAEVLELVRPEESK